MYRATIIFLILCMACSSKNKKETIATHLPERILFDELTNGDAVYSENVVFSNRGAQFESSDIAYVKSLLPEISSKKGVNISLWFKNTTTVPMLERMIFNIQDTINPNNAIGFWLAGNRITGRVNQYSLWAKQYDYTKGGSKEYYDLFRLEVGKFYFLSVNITNSTVEVFINGQLYAKYLNIPNTALQYHTVYLGIQKNADDTFVYQFQGEVRNFSVFNQILTPPEIKKLSLEAYPVIQPLNDAFELSKFNLEN